MILLACGIKARFLFNRHYLKPKAMGFTQTEMLGSSEAGIRSPTKQCFQRLVGQLDLSIRPN